MHASHFAVIKVKTKGRAKAASIIIKGKTINADTRSILRYALANRS